MEGTNILLNTAAMYSKTRSQFPVGCACYSAVVLAVVLNRMSLRALMLIIPGPGKENVQEGEVFRCREVQEIETVMLTADTE